MEHTVLVFKVIVNRDSLHKSQPVPLFIFETFKLVMFIWRLSTTEEIAYYWIIHIQISPNPFVSVFVTEPMQVCFLVSQELYQIESLHKGDLFVANKEVMKNGFQSCDSSRRGEWLPFVWVCLFRVMMNEYLDREA